MKQFRLISNDESSDKKFKKKLDKHKFFIRILAIIGALLIFGTFVISLIYM